MKRLLIIFLLIVPMASHAQDVQEKIERIVLDWIKTHVTDTCTVDTSGKFDPHTIVCSNGKEQRSLWNQMISSRLSGDKKAADSLKVLHDAFICDTTGYQVWYEFSYLAKDKKRYEILLSATTDRSMVIEEIIYYDPRGITELPSRLIYERRKKTKSNTPEEK